jgi:hypothetical protein
LEALSLSGFGFACCTLPARYKRGRIIVWSLKIV